MAEHRLKLHSQYLQDGHLCLSLPCTESTRSKEDRGRKIALQEGIEPAQTEWTSPIASAQQKNILVCFGINYRSMAALTVKDAHPVQRMDESMDTVDGACMLSRLKAISGYWGIKIDD